jgi:hypothetical protein
MLPMQVAQAAAHAAEAAVWASLMAEEQEAGAEWEPGQTESGLGMLP